MEGIVNKDNLKRCSKCLLPETFPFIEFDTEGVCNYCHNHKSISIQKNNELEKIADEIRSKDNKQDCIVMFSGGRDSSYLLHYAVKELKLNPLVFTYDWGMSTLVGDKNAEKVCKKLGVERIIVNGNVEKKLKHVRQNVKAWLKKPSLGMIPIFTAGDKHFFVEVNKIAKQRGLNTIFIGTNPYEKTYFKTGFCGVKPLFDSKRMYSLSILGKLKMILFYLKQFITNPAYINSSLWESFTGFFSFYQAKQEQIDIFKYIEWNEEKVNKLLFEEYDWEPAEDTPTTWRIGDATAPFYNYIYYHKVGFTENDTLRSNQIRENVITRSQGLELVEKENADRPNSIKWYLDRIGLDYEKTMDVINKM